MTPVHLGISTCPNDTFAFHAILNQKIDLRGLEFRIELLDVDELNKRLLRGEFDVAKASFYAAMSLGSEVGVLPAGSALGFGVGPLLLAARPDTHPRLWKSGSERSRARVLCPGEKTTATLLYRLFHAGEGDIEYKLFSEIMPELKEGTADFGVCIHEGRFTWRDQDLFLVEDLGESWEAKTSTPLPLGGIVARHRLESECIETVKTIIKDSIIYALEHRDDTLETMRQYAQELTDDVMFKHVDLYVNDWTVDLGDQGRAALVVLRRHAVSLGMLPGSACPLRVF
jgi:1,4-dihydroxy-6-naphthoate synthase